MSTGSRVRCAEFVFVDYPQNVNVVYILVLVWSLVHSCCNIGAFLSGCAAAHPEIQEHFYGTHHIALSRTQLNNTVLTFIFCCLNFFYIFVLLQLWTLPRKKQ